jgi:hypothetical protein
MNGVSGIYAREALPASSMAETREMIEHCSEQGLLETKYCDIDGQIHQYVRTTADFDDLKAYAHTQSLEGSEDGSAKRWWSKESRGRYHPDGPSLDARELFKPIIDCFLNGLRVKERFPWPGGVVHIL